MAHPRAPDPPARLHKHVSGSARQFSLLAALARTSVHDLLRDTPNVDARPSQAPFRAARAWIDEIQHRHPLVQCRRLCEHGLLWFGGNETTRITGISYLTAASKATRATTNHHKVKVSAACRTACLSVAPHSVTKPPHARIGRCTLFIPKQAAQIELAYTSSAVNSPRRVAHRKRGSTDSERGTTMSRPSPRQHSARPGQRRKGRSTQHIVPHSAGQRSSSYTATDAHERRNVRSEVNQPPTAAVTTLRAVVAIGLSNRFGPR